MWAPGTGNKIPATDDVRNVEQCARRGRAGECSIERFFDVAPTKREMSNSFAFGWSDETAQKKPMVLETRINARLKKQTP